MSGMHTLCRHERFYACLQKEFTGKNPAMHNLVSYLAKNLVKSRKIIIDSPKSL